MILEDQKGDSVHENGVRNKFPRSFFDYPIHLKLPENLLQKCQFLQKCPYLVTSLNQGMEILKMLCENRNKFELVIIHDVNTPDVHGCKLFELVGHEMDLPVILFSAHSDTGVTDGACGYELEWSQSQEFKNIWQHVARIRNNWSEDNLYHSKNLRKIKRLKERINKIRKERRKKRRAGQCVTWSSKLGSKFLDAIDQLGLEKACPKKILDLMNVDGLTTEDVAYYLEMHKHGLKREEILIKYDKIAKALRDIAKFGTLSGSRRDLVKKNITSKL